MQNFNPIPLAHSPISPTPDKPLEFQGKLLAWFRKNKRDLPWRTKGARDPYGVVVSEVMLQQTQVAVVRRYYDQWMAAFPTFQALAQAPIEKVLKAWEGLGYYHRARNLKKLAEAVVSIHGGVLPKEVPALEKLPGIGPYSARSIASLAYEVAAACVDGNIVRVFARLMAIDKPYKSGSAAQRDFQKIADEFLNIRHPGEHNEALMELGATVCTKASPLCLTCPVRELCKAQALGIVEGLPRLERARTENKFVRRVWIMHGGKLLLMRNARPRPAASRDSHAPFGSLQGLCELPTPESLGIKRLPKKELLRRVRNITKYKITEVVYKVVKIERLLPRLNAMEHLHWAGPEDLKILPLSGPHAQWIAELLGRKNQASV